MQIRCDCCCTVEHRDYHGSVEMAWSSRSKGYLPGEHAERQWSFGEGLTGPVRLCTPKSFFNNLGQPKAVFKSLVVQKKNGLLAIDEAPSNLVVENFQVWGSNILYYKKKIEAGGFYHCNLFVYWYTPLLVLYKPAFNYLKRLLSLFPSVPLMALMGTCDIVTELN